VATGPAVALSTTAAVLDGYGRRFGDRTVIDHVDLELREAEVVALLGASGSGKSTLLRALAGLDPEAEGIVEAPPERAVVFQDHRLLPWRRVWRNVIIGLRGRTRDDAIRALDEVGIAARADAWPGTLSGGESQRVALARAFIREPRLLLLDEPFGALDALTRIRMHALLRDLCDRHRPATLLVTHDVDEAIVLADRVLVLADGRITTDLRIDLSAGRRRTDPGVADLRARLLSQLGVSEDAVQPEPPLEH
jgi:sulfonate transport system ATP-binding protein